MANNLNGTDAPLTEQIKQQTHQAVDQGKQAAGQAVNLLRDQVKLQLSQRKDQVAVAVTDVGQWIQQSGGELKKQGYGMVVGPYLDAASGRLTEWGTSIQDKDIEEIVSQTEAFARVQPIIFLTSAAILGFFAARFLKSSTVQAA